MEILLALLLVSIAEKDGELKKRLGEALEFYRSHRDLILSLTHREEPSAEREKTPPPSTEEGLRILDEFLKTV